MLMVEDTGTSSQMAPISVTNRWAGFNNTVNTMNNAAEIFEQVNRFPVVLNTKEDYVLTVADGIPPNHMRFRLDIVGSGGTKVRVPYDTFRSVNITANGIVIANATAWNDAAGTNELLTKTQGCGEYRFVDSGSR